MLGKRDKPLYLGKENKPSFLHKVAYKVMEKRKKHNVLSLKTKKLGGARKRLSVIKFPA